MKKTTQTILKVLLLSVISLNSTSLLAESNQTEEDLSGGFFKVGVGYKFEQNPYEDEQNGLAMFVSGRYQTDIGLFIEASYGADKRKEGLNIGYNFYNTPNWNFDVTTVQAFFATQVEFTFEDEDQPGELITVREEQSSSEMLGFRTTGSFNQTNIQFIFAPILLNDDYDDGIYSSLWVSQTWQEKNWEFSATAGVEYRSEEIIAHYFEPTTELRRVGFPEYDASSGFDLTAQIGARYPISENVLFESYLRYTDFADSITDSPLIQVTQNIPGRDEDATEFGILFSYVF